MSDPNLPNPKPKNPRGGPDYHKPGCGCPACKARRRKAEAIARGDREPEKALVSDIIVSNQRTAKARVADWARLRAADPSLSNAEIAKMLGIAPGTLSNFLVKGRKEGWLKFEDPINKLHYEIIPKATDNIAELLDEKDRTTTLAVFNSVIAPIFRESVGVSDQAQNVIALKIEMPPADQMPIVKGKIVGAGRAFTIENAEEEES